MPLFRALAKNMAPMTNADESPTNRLTLFPIYLSLFVVSTLCQGVMHPTSGQRTGACTLGLMNTRSQINLKSIIMCMIASILNMFFPY